MKYVFFWAELFNCGTLEPCCECPQASAEDKCVLASLLMDDGGLGREFTDSWLAAGLQMVSEVREGRADMHDWGRETFGAEIERGGVKLYSHYVDSYFDVLDFEEFAHALLSWQQFLLAGPGCDGRARAVVDIHVRETGDWRPVAS